MAKFTKSELKKSLKNGLTLLERNPNDFLWAEHHELPFYLSQRYEIVNDEKKELYNKERGRWEKKN